MNLVVVHSQAKKSVATQTSRFILSLVCATVGNKLSSWLMGRTNVCLNRVEWGLKQLLHTIMYTRDHYSATAAITISFGKRRPIRQNNPFDWLIASILHTLNDNRSQSISHLERWGSIMPSIHSADDPIADHSKAGRPPFSLQVLRFKVGNTDNPPTTRG